MERLHEQEIAAILAVQQLSPALDGLARAVTFLGDEPFFLLVLPLVYWCIDRRVGARLTVALLLSGWANGVLKLVFDLPRPAGVDARVEEIRPTRGGGMPSGHAMNTVVFWGVLATAFRRPLLWGVFAAAIVLVPLSRLYLGVHFPSDLVAGIALGALMLAAFAIAAPRVEHWLAASAIGWQLTAATVVPTVLLLICSDHRIAGRAAAALLGVAVGLVIERRWIRFSPAGVPIIRRALAWLLGVAVLTALWLGLQPALETVFGVTAARIAGYTVIGLWVAAGAPALFVALGLSSPRPG